MAILHDIGKVRELEVTPSINYTEEGNLLDNHHRHPVDRRKDRPDTRVPAEAEIARRTHDALAPRAFRLGVSAPPMFLEAEILHRADDLDVKWTSFATRLPRTATRNRLGRPIRNRSKESYTRSRL